MKKSKKFLLKSIMSFALTIALVLGAIPVNGLVTSVKADGPITMTAPIEINSSNRSQYEGKTLTGTYSPSMSLFDNLKRGAIIIDGGVVNLTINDLNINIPGDGTKNVSGILLRNNATLNLTLQGSNSLYAAGDGAGICVPAGCTLNITETSTGSLIADGGCNTGETAAHGGAGIGAEGTNDDGVGTINIKGGTITAVGGSTRLAMQAGAAGIGGAVESKSTGIINISGGNVTAKAYYGNAAIGGAYSDRVESITISGGTITATVPTSAPRGASIGCGASGSTSSKLSCGTVRITGGTVTTNGNIGYGDGGPGVGYAGGSVTISPSADITSPDWVKCTIDVTIYDNDLTSDISDATLTVTGDSVGTLNATIHVAEPKKGTAVFQCYRSIFAVGISGTFTVSGGGHTWTKYASLPSVGGNLVMTGSYTGSITTYLDENGKEQTTPEAPTPLEAGTGALGDGWYTVSSDVEFSADNNNEQLLEINGDVKLILCDDAELKANDGVFINDGKTLTIYAQSKDTSHMGKLTAISQGYWCAPGIFVGGSLVINGGYITARGKMSAAGIGGGSQGNKSVDSDDNGSITINDGVVDAEGDSPTGNYGMGAAATISGTGGTITINGGQVTAKSRGMGGQNGTIRLGWKEAGDKICAANYDGTVTLEKSFVEEGTNTLVTKDTIAGKTIVPACKISFDENGGTGSMSAQGACIDSGFTLPVCTFTRSGYEFAGWNTVKNPTEDNLGLVYTDGGTVYPNSDLSLYAQWRALPAIAPTITTDLEDLALITGYTSKSLSIQANTVAGTTNTYQWYSCDNTERDNAAAIIGATNKDYTIADEKTGGTTEYYFCVVTATRDDNGQTATTTSRVATVTVTDKTEAGVSISGTGVSEGAKTVTYGDEAFALTGSITAEGTGTGTWTWTSNDTDVAVISDNTTSTPTIEIKKVTGSTPVTITAAYESDTTIGTATLALTVNKKEVTIDGLSAENKSYDGDADATVTGTAVINGLETGDSEKVSISAGTAAFDDKNVGTGKTVSFTGYSLSGEAAGNYTLSAQPVDVTADITPQTITVASGITASDKPYDGTTIATLDCSSAVLTGKATGDNLTVSATGTFEDINVGNDKTVQLGGYVLGGTDKDNYVLAENGHQATTTAGIIKKTEIVQLTDISSTQSKNKSDISIPVTITATDAGTITGYALNTEASVDGTGGTQVSDVAVSQEGLVTAKVSNGASGDKIIIPVKVVAQNYDSTVNVVVTLNNPHSHYYTATVTKEATCTEDGERTYRCSCGSSYTETIKAEGHSIKTQTAKEATCTEDGNEAYYECSKCGKVYADAQGKTETKKEDYVIKAAGHKLTAHEAVETTCTEDGKKAYWECSECKKLFSDAEGKTKITENALVIKAPGHKLTAHAELKATCTEDGKKAYWECSECKKIFIDAEAKTETALEKTVIKAEGHKLTAHEAKEATCTEDGNKAYWECSVCKKLFADAEGKSETTEDAVVIKSEGHKLTHVEAKEPTEEEDGNIEYWVCSECGKFFSDAEGKTEISEEDTKITKYLDITQATVTGLATKAYTGKAITPVLTLKYDGKTLKKGTDYTVAYANNTKPGTATVTIEGKGDYAGTVTKKFIIKQISFKYRAYVQKKNWMTWSTAKVSGTEASKMAGTTQDLRMETIQMQLSGVSGSVEYRAYCSKKGWTQWATTADTKTYAGTKGEARRVELIQLRAKGQVANLYDMYFRAYSEKLGWLNWAKSGEKAGTQGYAYKLEAFQVNFVIKGETFKLATQNKMAKSFYDKTKDGANPN